MLDVCTLALTGGNWRALELLKFPRMHSKGAVNSHRNELLNGKLFFLMWTKVGYFLNGPRTYSISMYFYDIKSIFQPHFTYVM